MKSGTDIPFRLLITAKKLLSDSITDVIGRGSIIVTRKAVASFPYFTKKEVIGWPVPNNDVIHFSTSEIMSANSFVHLPLAVPQKEYRIEELVFSLRPRMLNGGYSEVEYSEFSLMKISDNPAKGYLSRIQPSDVIIISNEAGNREIRISFNLKSFGNYPGDSLISLTDSFPSNEEFLMFGFFSDNYDENKILGKTVFVSLERVIWFDGFERHESTSRSILPFDIIFTE